MEIKKTPPFIVFLAFAGMCNSCVFYVAVVVLVCLCVVADVAPLCLFVSGVDLCLFSLALLLSLDFGPKHFATCISQYFKKRKGSLETSQIKPLVYSQIFLHLLVSW